MALCEELSSIEELEIFNAKSLLDLIDFKWNTYAYKIHYVGIFFHLFYIVTVFIYIYTTFLTGKFDKPGNIIYTEGMIIGIFYPFAYDTIQLLRTGLDYFKDGWNWADIVYQYVGILNIYLQFNHDPETKLYKTISMTIVLNLMLVKSFFYLRISSRFAYLVTMINAVFGDLINYIIFFILTLYFFGLGIGVMGW